jgi:hypothetical protein
VSYAARQYRTENVARSLLPGQALQLLDDANNEANSAALLLAALDGSPVGWIPDLLVGYTRQVWYGGEGEVTLVQNNGEAAPWHARQLVTLKGHVDAGTRTFSGGIWPEARVQ